MTTTEEASLIFDFMRLKAVKTRVPEAHTPVYHINYNDLNIHLTFSLEKRARHYFVKNAEFHTSWDWLLPVWNKIRKTEKPLSHKTERLDMLNALVSLDHERLYKLVVKHIINYNKKKK